MLLQTLFFIGFGEMIAVVAVIVLVFGTDKLPEIIRTFTSAIRQLKQASEDIKREIIETTDDTIVKEITELKDSVDDAKKDVQEQIEEIKNTVKRPS